VVGDLMARNAHGERNSRPDRFEIRFRSDIRSLASQSVAKSVVFNSYQNFKRAVRAFRGRDLWQRRQVDCTELRLGNKGAQWCICPDGLSASSVVYSFGVGQDVSFELELIRQFRVRVHAFDPTPKSIEWLGQQSLPENFVFHDYGIADHDGICVLLPPANPAHVSHTIVNRNTPGSAIEVPVRRLASIMKSLGHSKIDLLKMDVEGTEYGVIEDLLNAGIAVGQLLVEFHHRWPEVGIGPTVEATKKLNRAGYLIFSVAPGGEEYGFLRVRSKPSL
jgi:FkbM family methyltransferase